MSKQKRLRGRFLINTEIDPLPKPVTKTEVHAEMMLENRWEVILLVVGSITRMFCLGMGGIRP